MKKQSLIILIGGLLIVSVLLSCSKKITGNGPVQVEISAALNGSQGINEDAVFELTIEGVGIQFPIVRILELKEGRLVGTVIVPAGPERSFRIEAYDTLGILIYRGITILDIEAGESLDIRISLYPQVPMIKLSPTYAQKPQSAVLPVEIRVYNLIDINTLDVKLSNSSVVTERILWPDSIVINPRIGNFTTMTDSFVDEGIKYLRFKHFNENYQFVDDSGYALLATAYYQTVNLDPILIDTFDFKPEIMFLQNNTGDTLPLGDIYVEDSRAELFHFTVHRVGYWAMNWDGPDSTVVPDSSNNDLHGTATGTYMNEGLFGNARFFEGEGDYIEVPYDPLLDIEEAITISFWVNIDSSLQAGTIFSKRAENGSINYQMTVGDPSSDSGISFFFEYGSTLQTFRINTPDLHYTGWRHIVFSYEFGNPSSALFLLDAEPVEGTWIIGGGREEAPLRVSPLFIGRSNSSTPLYFSGGLDEFILFDVALDQDVIRQLPYYQK